MGVTESLQFTSKFGICGIGKYSQQLKSLCRRGELHFPATSLSSLYSGQDVLRHRFSESIKMPLCSIPLRYNSLNCYCCLKSGSHITNSCLKTIATQWTRSYNSLQGSPSITKLIAAVAVVVFTLWGLGPLVRTSRKLFLNKHENSWRKSTTHYVLTSYIQPALLWTGAMLVTGALDPIAMPTEASHLIKQRVLNFIRSLSTVLSFAYCLSCAIQQAHKFFIQTADTSDTRNMGFQFAAKAVSTAVWVAAVSLFMELLGFSTQKLLTAGGLGTVLLTLSGREIFTNFLSSAMIHATRPFLLNEWIQTKIEGYDISGTVEHIGWWSPTIIRGEDREAIHIPNHKFTVSVVRNITQKTHWRIKTHLAISHLDVSKINNIVADMRKVLSKNPQVEQQKLHRRVFLDEVDPENQALLILVSCFVKTSHHEEYYCVKEAVLLDLLRVIRHHGARLATPIRTIQKISADADMEPIRNRAATTRPFLLIDSSYKINSEDRAKAPTPSRRASGDQGNRGTGQKSTSDSKMDVNLNRKPASEPKGGVETSKSGTKTETSNFDKESKAADSTLEPPSSASSKGTTGPALVENIVLGVALEGSKRTLPIDDDNSSSRPPVEAKEAAANQHLNGNGREIPAAENDEDS